MVVAPGHVDRVVPRRMGQRHDRAALRPRNVLIQETSRHRTDATRPDDVSGNASRTSAVGKWGPRNRIHRIPQLRTERGEVSRPLRIGRHDRLTGTRLAPVPQSLIRAEPEQLVSDDGAAGAGARLILALLGLPSLEEAAGVESGVAMELPRCSVEVIRSRFRYDTDLAPRGVPV